MDVGHPMRAHYCEHDTPLYAIHLPIRSSNKIEVELLDSNLFILL